MSSSNTKDFEDEISLKAISFPLIDLSPENLEVLFQRATRKAMKIKRIGDNISIKGINELQLEGTLNSLMPKIKWSFPEPLFYDFKIEKNFNKILDTFKAKFCLNFVEIGEQYGITIGNFLLPVESILSRPKDLKKQELRKLLNKSNMGALLKDVLLTRARGPVFINYLKRRVFFFFPTLYPQEHVQWLNLIIKNAGKNTLELEQEILRFIEDTDVKRKEKIEENLKKLETFNREEYKLALESTDAPLEKTYQRILNYLTLFG